MISRKILAAILAIVVFVNCSVFAQTPVESGSAELAEVWNDYLHYIKIGRFDMAAGFAQVILQSNPDPAQLLAFSRDNPEGYKILLMVNEAKPDAQLAELTGKIIGLIEGGRFAHRADAKIIAEEVKGAYSS